MQSKRGQTMNKDNLLIQTLGFIHSSGQADALIKYVSTEHKEYLKQVFK